MTEIKSRGGSDSNTERARGETAGETRAALEYGNAKLSRAVWSIMQRVARRIAMRTISFTFRNLSSIHQANRSSELIAARDVR